MRFRKTINYAIDREEILYSVYLGLGSITDWLDSTYDVDEANRLLDEMGMEKGSDGYRLSPSGKKFTLSIEFTPRAPDIEPVAELIAAMLEEVGIRTAVKNIEYALFYERMDANQLMGAIMWNEAIWYNIISTWPMKRICRTGWWYWCKSGGTEDSGGEPPTEMKDIFKLAEGIASSKPQDEIMKFEEFKKNIKDNVWYFQILGKVKQPIIANAKLGNVDPKDSIWGIGLDFCGETFFFNE